MCVVVMTYSIGVLGVHDSIPLSLNLHEWFLLTSVAVLRGEREREIHVSSNDEQCIHSTEHAHYIEHSILKHTVKLMVV